MALLAIAIWGLFCLAVGVARGYIDVPLPDLANAFPPSPSTCENAGRLARTDQDVFVGSFERSTGLEWGMLRTPNQLDFSQPPGEQSGGYYLAANEPMDIDSVEDQHLAPGPGQWVSAMKLHHFTRGWKSVWEKDLASGTRSVMEEILEFRTKRDALAAHRWTAGFACSFSRVAFGVADVPYAYGTRYVLGDGSEDLSVSQVSFVAGNRRITISARVPVGERNTDDIGVLARTALFSQQATRDQCEVAKVFAPATGRNTSGLPTPRRPKRITPALLLELGITGTQPQELRHPKLPAGGALLIDKAWLWEQTRIRQLTFSFDSKSAAHEWMTSRSLDLCRRAVTFRYTFPSTEARDLFFIVQTPNEREQVLIWLRGLQGYEISLDGPSAVQPFNFIRLMGDALNPE